MMKKINYLILLLILFSFSCKNDEDLSNSGKIELKQVLEALGGETKINSINTVSYDVEGSTFEYEQQGPVVSYPINGNNHSYHFSSELNRRKVRMEYDAIHFNYPFVYNGNGALLIINNKEGVLQGQYNWSSYYLGATEPKAIYSARLEAVLKNQKMANPIELIKDVNLKNNSSNQSTDNTFLIPSGVDNLNIELVIDENTFLPIKAKIMEADFLKGDVIFEIIYSDWTQVSGIKYPTNLTYKYNGDVIRTESLSNILIDPQLPEDNFDLGERTQISYDEEQAKYGIYSSQWYHRLFAGGIPIDQPLNNGALILEDFDLSAFGMQTQTIGENLKIVGRPDSSNWSVAIKTSSGIHIVEAPINPRWTRSIINAVKNEFPNQPIKSLIPTHTHYDHLGGIREMAAEVDKIFVATKGIPIIESILNSTHELLPDALSINPNSYSIEEVTGITKIDNGAIEIHLLKTSDADGNPFAVNNSHSEDMVVIYVPEYQTLIQADFLYAGIFLKIWNGEMTNAFTGRARIELSNRASFLVDYIEEKGLNVTKIIGIHGGVSSFNDLKNVAGN